MGAELYEVNVWKYGSTLVVACGGSRNFGCVGAKRAASLPALAIA